MKIEDMDIDELISTQNMFIDIKDLLIQESLNGGNDILNECQSILDVIPYDDVLAEIDSQIHLLGDLIMIKTILSGIGISHEQQNNMINEIKNVMEAKDNLMSICLN